MIRFGTTPVRLTREECGHILQAVEAVSEEIGMEWEKISLFGSRVDLHQHGGDIDLYIKIRSNHDPVEVRRKLRVAIQERIGEQKVDLIIDNSLIDLGPFGELVLKQKIDIWAKN